MTINERMQFIVDKKFNGNKAAFAKALGIAPTSISNYLSKSRASKPTSDIVQNGTFLVHPSAIQAVELSDTESDDGESQIRLDMETDEDEPVDAVGAPCFVIVNDIVDGTYHEDVVIHTLGKQTPCGTQSYRKH